MFEKLRRITHGRRAKRVRADFYLNKIVDDQPHLARARDISTRGIYIYKILEPALPLVSNTVGLEFQLPDSEEVIWAIGEIVRDEPAVTRKKDKWVNGVAIRFTRIDDQDRRRIREFVDANS